MTPRRSRILGDAGSVAAEFAIAMPAVLLVLAAALGGTQLAGLQLRAQDAAADAARLLGRGDGAAVGAHVAARLPGASWASSTRGDFVCVRVTVAPGGPGAGLGLYAEGSGCALADGG